MQRQRAVGGDIALTLDIPIATNQDVEVSYTGPSQIWSPDPERNQIAGTRRVIALRSMGNAAGSVAAFKRQHAENNLTVANADDTAPTLGTPQARITPPLDAGREPTGT